MRLILALALAAAVATPALAADRLVPDTATGALAEHKGKPWRVPLTNCAGFHTWNGRNLGEAGDSDASWNEAGKAADFMIAAARRISEDEGKTVEQATAGNKQRILNVVTSLDMSEPDVAGWTRVCQEYLAGYRKAFP
jgi:hypothetical protein